MWLKSILDRHMGFLTKNRIPSIILIAFICISCSNLSFSKKELPKKLKYDKVEFEPCAYSGSDYLCITNNDAIKLTLNLKQCQEQNSLLREINGN
jgi:hypothetical protein